MSQGFKNGQDTVSKYKGHVGVDRHRQQECSLAKKVKKISVISMSMILCLVTSFDKLLKKPFSAIHIQPASFESAKLEKV